jgi:hypothetical protein
MSFTSHSTSFSQIRVRVSEQIATLRARREHDLAMADRRVRDEHFAARGRAMADGHDCPFCA